MMLWWMFGMFFGLFLLGSIFSMQSGFLNIDGCFGFFTLYAKVKLTVEFNASNRALAFIRQTGITDYYSNTATGKALPFAVSTYIIAALSLLVALLYFWFAFYRQKNEK
jgi:Zn-dependent membrane protease YugP